MIISFDGRRMRPRQSLYGERTGGGKVPAEDRAGAPYGGEESPGRNPGMMKLERWEEGIGD
jgi:hypothetical protein